MSAIRLPVKDADGCTRVRFVDPYTHAPYVPEQRGSVGPGPVEIIRPATCAAPARAPRMQAGALTLVNRQERGTYIAQFTDDEVLGAIAATGSQAAAAERLGVGQASVYRRLAQIKAALR